MDLKKLYRSDQDKIIAGVCGGMGRYLGIDSTVIRLLWALWCGMGIGIIAYIVAAVIIPKELY